MTTKPDGGEGVAFGASRQRFEALVGFLEGNQATALSHGELECRLQVLGAPLFDHLLAGLRDHQPATLDAHGVGPGFGAAGRAGG